jgi:hypothetical protein
MGRKMNLNGSYNELGLTPRLWRRLSRQVYHAYDRCNGPNPNYGGRGIRVVFRSHLVFIAWLATLPGHDDESLWLDRCDPNGHYWIDNLRYVTPSESRRNQRRK